MLGMGGGGAVPKDDWTFEIRSGGGHLRVTAAVLNMPSPNQRPNQVEWRLKRIVAGDTDITDAALDLPASATMENVVIEMTTRVSQVDATVVYASGAAVRDCVVVVFPRDSQQWVWQSRFFAVGRPDPESVFHGRVPAGEYLVVAFDDPEPALNVFADPDILSQLRDRATTISLGQDEKKSIELKLSQPPVY